jgi:RNA polymerase sigma-70 factor (ECF subfamily)
MAVSLSAVAMPAWVVNGSSITPHIPSSVSLIFVLFMRVFYNTYGMDKTEISQLSDEALVTRALTDKQLFGELIDRYEQKLTRYITRLGVKDPDDQLDVMQEVFLKIYKNLNGFDTKLAFSSWAYRIAHNEAVSWYRKRSVRPEGHLVAESDEVVSLIASKELSADAVVDQAFNAQELSRALNAIDEKYREVLILRFFEHKEYDEISDILKLPIGSVGTLLHRGKKKLLAELNEHAIRI